MKIYILAILMTMVSCSGNETSSSGLVQKVVVKEETNSQTTSGESSLGEAGNTKIVYLNTAYKLRNSVYAEDVTAKVNGTSVQALPTENGEIFLLIPDGLNSGKLDIELSNSSDSIKIDSVFYLADATVPLFSGSASEICREDSFYNAEGQLSQGTKNCSGYDECKENNETACVTTAKYRSFDPANLLAGNIKSGETINNVTGSLNDTNFYEDCDTDGETGCLAENNQKLDQEQ